MSITMAGLRKVAQVVALAVVAIGLLAFQGSPSAHAASALGEAGSSIASVTSTKPVTYTSVRHVPMDATQCAAIEHYFPQSAHSAYACTYTETTTVSISVPTSAAAAPHLDVSAHGIALCGYYGTVGTQFQYHPWYGGWGIEQDGDFYGDGCSTPKLSGSMCYINWTYFPYGASVTQCSLNYVDASGNRVFDADFWITSPVGSFRERLQTGMPPNFWNYWMYHNPQ